MTSPSELRCMSLWFRNTVSPFKPFRLFVTTSTMLEFKESLIKPLVAGVLEFETETGVLGKGWVDLREVSNISFSSAEGTDVKVPKSGFWIRRDTGTPMPCAVTGVVDALAKVTQNEKQGTVQFVELTSGSFMTSKEILFACEPRG